MSDDSRASSPTDPHSQSFGGNHPDKVPVALDVPVTPTKVFDEGLDTSVSDADAEYARTFRDFDSNNSGTLSLDELLQATDDLALQRQAALNSSYATPEKGGGPFQTGDQTYDTPDRPRASSKLASLFTLYLFDTNREGSINYSEFVSLMRKMREAEEEAAEHAVRLEEATPSLIATRARALSAPQAAGPFTPSPNKSGSAAVPRIGSNAENHIDHATPIKSTAGPVAIGGSPSMPSSPSIRRSGEKPPRGMKKSQSCIRNDGVTIMPSPKTSIDESDISSTSYDIRPSVERVVEDYWTEKYWGLFRPMLSDSAAMDDFRQWLFKLVDVDQSEAVSTEELKYLLRLLENDGLDVAALVFDEENNRGMIAERIMNQYDKGGSGDLTREEFSALADLIVSEYIRHDKHATAVCVGPFRMTRLLGDGTYGAVYLGVSASSGVRRAIKVIQKGNVRQMSRVDTEISAMAKLTHPHVVNLHEVYETPTHTYLSMELCEGGSLYDQVVYNPLDEGTTRYYFAQLLDGLAYCHSRRVCHRDVRIENLLLDNHGNVKISDFGHAGLFKKGWDLFTTQMVGSLYYMAPEQVQNECYSGVKLDTWMCGVVLHYLLLRRPPFYADNIQELFEMIVEGKLDLPDTLSLEVRDLLTVMLATDPEQRPSVRRVRKHPWVQMAKSKPSLTLFEMPLVGPRYADLDIIWTAVSNLLIADPEIHPYATRDKVDAESTHRTMKCRHRSHELKFSVILRDSSAPESMAPLNPEGTIAEQAPSRAYLLFYLKEGESRLFGEFVHFFEDEIKNAIEGPDREQTVHEVSTPVQVTRHFDNATPQQSRVSEDMFDTPVRGMTLLDADLDVDAAQFATL